MLALAALARLLRLRACACVVLACLATALCATHTASALEDVQPKTRVWVFEFAQPLNVWLERAASPRTHLENQSGSPEPASVSPHAATAAPKLFSSAEREGLKQLFGSQLKGAQEALKAVREGMLGLPDGVTRGTLERYRDQILNKGLQDIPVQQERLRIIEEILRR